VTCPPERHPALSNSVRLDELEATLADREAALEAFKAELRELQDAYLDKMGAWQAQLAELDAAVAEAEIAAGLRPATERGEDDDDETGQDADPSPALRACASRPAPTADLRRIFRDVAKAIHPDLGPNDPSRYRRHSLMAEANRAYANRDEDRLRLILRAWERSADVLPEDGADALARVGRRIAEIDARLVAIEMEFGELKRSAIWQLKIKIDEARARGWDLFAEMVMHIKREISRANARLAVLRREAAR
jgi:predicted  nucleic acid-binding Zn-ribbon protein